MRSKKKGQQICEICSVSEHQLRIVMKQTEIYGTGDHPYNFSEDIQQYAASLEGSPGGLPAALIAATADQEKLIRVYQAALEEGNDNKLITVYEIKPENLADAAGRATSSIFYWFLLFTNN